MSSWWRSLSLSHLIMIKNKGSIVCGFLKGTSVVREGYPFVGAAALFTVFMFLFHFLVLAVLGIVVTAFMVFFFRDPERNVPSEEYLITSPADGWIVALDEAVDEREAKRLRKISIFMTVFDVHVNRSPCNGTIVSVKHSPGRFLAAQKSRASIENERNRVVIRHDRGDTVVVVQVAGLIARRIVFWKKEGDEIRKGERIGMIRFGSRVDVYVPLEWPLKVSRGQKVKAGETVLCIMK